MVTMNTCTIRNCTIQIILLDPPQYYSADAVSYNLFCHV